MKKPHMFLGLAFCALSITLAGNVLAVRSNEAIDNQDEQIDERKEKIKDSKDCHLFLVKRDQSVQEASLEAGKPIDNFHLFVTDNDGKTIKNAQIVITIIDQCGNQQSSRALPFKGGYTLAVDYLSAGQYTVEAEIFAKCQLLTDMFKIVKV